MGASPGLGGGGEGGVTRVVANIFISFIGAGVLGLPYAFREAGLLEGAVVMVAVCYLSIRAMLLLIDCKYMLLGMVEGGGGTREEGTELIKVNGDPVNKEGEEDDVEVGLARRNR